MRRSRAIAAAAAAVTAFGVAYLVVPRWGALRRAPHAVWDRIAFAEERAAGIDLELVARGFFQITSVEFVPGAPLAAVVLEKGGTARVVALPGYGERRVVDAKDASPLFRVKVRDAHELGLLGLAFSPRFLENGLFYVNYNPADGEMRTRVSEWSVAPGRVGKEPARERRVLLEVAQPYTNHNGGGLAFGPDGMLYIGLGDGGAGGDPHGHGQNLGSLLGKMLRIDPSKKDPNREYAVPPDNPFVGRAEARPEIWAYGLRNPWRYSFDPKGRLIAADVGQSSWEEIDIVERGQNLGWNLREGAHCFARSSSRGGVAVATDCSKPGLVDPIFEYERSLGISVTGGYVYTGKRVAELSGRYVFGDFGSGRLFALELPSSVQRAPARLLGRFRYAFSTFGRDAAGEIYAADFGGDLYRIVAR